jgi:outer membrane protein assembly factor BamB
MTSDDEFEIVSDQTVRAGDPLPPAREHRWRMRAAPWVAGAVALVLIGAATASPTRLILGRGDGPEIGLVDLDLSQRPTVVWETTLSAGYSIEDIVGDRAVLSTHDAAPTVLALDLATGEPTWTYDIDAHTCQWGSPVVCVQDPGAADAAIVSVDLATGTESSRPYPEAVAAIAVDDGVAVILQTSSPIEDVVMLDAGGGERWRVAADAADLQNVPWWAFVHRVGEELWFETTTTVRIDIETGRVTTGPADGFVLEDGTSISITGDIGMIRTAEGEARVALDETVMWTDDDLGGVVQLMTTPEEGMILAQVRGSTSELWRFAEPGCNPEARLSGVVVISCWNDSGPRLYGVDEVTGETVWDQSGNYQLAAASTDTLVFASTTDADMRGVDPITGDVRWHLPTPAGANAGHVLTTPTPDGLLVSTGASIQRLIWP